MKKISKLQICCKISKNFFASLQNIWLKGDKDLPQDIFEQLRRKINQV